MRTWIVALGLCAAGCVNSLSATNALTAGSANDGGAPKADAPRGQTDGAIPPPPPGTDASRPPPTGTSCSDRNYAFCEDFEGTSGTAIPSGWQPDNGWGPGDTTTSSARPHWGSRSLLSSSAPNGQQRISRDLADLGGTATSHWGRVFFNSVTFGQGAEWFHGSFVSFATNPEIRIVDTVRAANGTNQFLLNRADDECCASSQYSWNVIGDQKWHRVAPG
jgi:hypothetical protein